ncbi:hypothetical protein Ddye_015677 [Dipteronia dyeriana]|uniref:Uncharacterized protein n=1 Tax=Dipteronia dyeriana TaxID=168575 RepID=A0AAD9U613_9ROSI|nr:hypothetical protein Ddye_015677 [Dipteronia dyeriana]
MDSRLPVAKRTRSREALMFREYHERIKKKLEIGGSESMTQSASTVKEDESVKLPAKSIGSGNKNVEVDCGVDSEVHIVCEEESANVGGRDKGKSVVGGNVGAKDKGKSIVGAIVGRKGKGKSIVCEGMDNTMTIMIDDSDEDVVFLGDEDDLRVEEHDDVVCLNDEDDGLGESSSFYSNDVDENGGLNCDGEKTSGVAGHESFSDDDDDDGLEEFSDDLMVFSSEEDNDDTEDEDYVDGNSDSSAMVEEASSSSEEVNDVNSSSEEEEENYGVREIKKRGSDGGDKSKRVENLGSSNAEAELGTASNPFSEEDLDSLTILRDGDNDDSDDAQTHQRVCKSVAKKWPTRYGRGKDNKILHTVSKQHKGKLGKSKIKHNSMMKDQDVASNPFSEEDLDSLTKLRDSDNDDSDDAQTHQRVCKTVAKKWPTRYGRGKDNKILHTVSRQHKGKLGKSKIKNNSMMKDQDVEEILLSSILNGEEIPLENSLFSKSERSQLNDDTVLPLKFYFGYEEPTPPEKSEFEKELDNLWTDMDFAIASSAIGHTDSSMDKNEVKLASEVEQDQSTLCSQGKHQLIHDDEIGIICKFCSFVQLEIRYVVPPFAKNPSGRYRRDSRIEDDPGPSDLHFQDSDFDSQSGLDPSCSQAEGTVWDLVPGVKNNMYPHQCEGFEFIWRNIAGGIDLDKLKHSTISDGGNGCIISHAPGTGKTRLAIVFIQAYMKMYPACRPVIIAPCNMLLTWEDEFKKWKTGITFHNLNSPVLSGTELLEIQNPHESLIRTMKLLSWKKGGGVLGVSYSRFKIIVGSKKNTEKKSREVDEQMKKILLELPGIFVFDEGHIPRNEQTDLFKSLSEIQTEKRIILSGTPFQNNFEELFNTFYLVRPKFADGMRSGRLRDSVTKRGRKRKGEKGQWTYLTSSIGKDADDRLSDEKKLDELRTVIAPFVHVHKGTVLQDSLPGLRQSVVVLRPFDLQKRLLEGAEAIGDMIKQNWYVSLIAAHPSLLLEQSNENEELIDNRAELERLRLNPEVGIKTKFLMELLRLSEALNEKVLVFSQYIKPLTLIRDQLRESFDWIEGREVLYMDGKQDVRLRQSSINVFNDPSSEVKVLLASKTACCEGINLVGASRLVLLDVAWNPSVDRQAISRAYRLGQKKFVHVYRLITSGTMEEKKCSRQARKDWLSKSVFTSDEEANAWKISSNTIEDKILEEMVQHDKQKYIENIIEEYDESKLIDTYGILGER